MKRLLIISSVICILLVFSAACYAQDSENPTARGIDWSLLISGLI